jgi:hypothetical protein
VTDLSRDLYTLGARTAMLRAQQIAAAMRL